MGRLKNPHGPFHATRSDGRTLQINEVKTPDGRTAIIRTDITNSLQIEESLAQNEEIYRTLVDSSPNAIYFHKDEQIIFTNPAMADLAGAALAEELIG